jgi:hypothetical protein
MRRTALVFLLLSACLPPPPGEDFDGDGYGWKEDCNDADATIHPGADETYYDGIDQDCVYGNEYDKDGDGYDSADYDGDDCDDENPGLNPGVDEVWYDGKDSDCSGGSDYDQDGDGYDSDAYGGDDCDDNKPDVNPDAEEVWYDGVDQDCAGDSDYDQDGDGWGNADDCDDTRPDINPAQPEALNGYDDDCDEVIDEVPWGGGPHQVESLHGGLHGESTYQGLGYSFGSFPMDAVGPGNVGGTSLEAPELVQDGFTDLLITAPLDGWLAGDVSPTSAVYLVPGGDRADLELDDIAERTALRLEPWDADNFFGATTDFIPSYDGDSIPEIVVGAPAWTGIGPNVGKAFVFESDEWKHASAVPTEGGFNIRRLDASDASVTIISTDTGDGLGDVISFADPMGGTAYLLVTAPETSSDGYGGEPGAVLIYSTDTLHDDEDGVLYQHDCDYSIVGTSDHQHVGEALPTLAMLDGDSSPVLVVSSSSKSGVMGTVDGLVAAAPMSTIGAGTSSIEALDYKLLGGSGIFSLGKRLAGGPDVDGDGYSELAVHGESSAGDPIILVISGGIWAAAGTTTATSATMLRIEGAEAPWLLDEVPFTFSGDFNGDRFPELVIGSTTGEPANNGGRISIFYGAPDLGGTVQVLDAPAQIAGPEGSYLGYTALTAMDLNTDGWSELVVGAPGFDPDGTANSHPGAVFILDPLMSW